MLLRIRRVYRGLFAADHSREGTSDRYRRCRCDVTFLLVLYWLLWLLELLLRLAIHRTRCSSFGLFMRYWKHRRTRLGVAIVPRRQLIHRRRSFVHLRNRRLLLRHGNERLQHPQLLLLLTVEIDTRLPQRRFGVQR